MNARWWLLYVGVALFVCLGPMSVLRAQEQQSAATETLPQIIKRIQPCTVAVLIYDEKDKLKGRGSGFFVSRAGHIITNRHVLEGASRAEIKTAQGKVHPITHILAEDKQGDLVLASVDIPPGSAEPLKLSKSIPLVGQRIMVIGNPRGFEGTVSDGIVSAVRDIPAFGKIIQLSAPISPGSSGSPVVDMKGQVIGIATFQFTEGQNLNFAMPSQRAVKLKPGKPRTLAQWQKPALDKKLTLAQRDYRNGLTYLWAEDYKKALPFFKKAVEKNPRYAEAWFRIGYCNYQVGRYAEAVAACKQAIRIKPDLAEAHHNLGVTYNKLGRYTEAIEAYKQAIRFEPDDADPYYNLGVAYNKLGRYAEAIMAYKQVIRIEPGDAQAYNNLGNTYGDLGRHNEAIKAYKQAIRIKPDYAAAHYHLGNTYDDLGRYSEALESYKQAIRIKPDFTQAHNNLGTAYGRLKRYTEAIAAFKQAIHIKPDHASAHCGLGLAYVMVGDRGSALEQYKILKSLDKELANMLFNLIYE